MIEQNAGQVLESNCRRFEIALVSPSRNGASQRSEKDSATQKLAQQAATYALEKKAENIRIFDLRPLTTITDFFVICSGGTDTHVRAIADHVVEQFEAQQMKPWHVEGRERLQWVLLDYVDLVVHVFQPEVREFYGLERLWGDAETQEIREETAPGEVRRNS